LHGKGVESGETEKKEKKVLDGKKEKA